MTPAIDLVKAAGVSFTIHSFQHEAGANSFGEEAVEQLDIDPSRIFKTLLTQTNSGTILVAVIPVSCQLSLKLVASHSASKKVVMAEKNKIQRVTGYQPGGVSPIGQKNRFSTLIDVSATSFDTIFVSAGRRGLEIELSPNDLLRLTDANYCKLTV